MKIFANEENVEFALFWEFRKISLTDFANIFSVQVKLTTMNWFWILLFISYFFISENEFKVAP